MSLAPERRSPYNESASTNLHAAFLVLTTLGSPPSRDRDRDGLSDALERRTGTDPLSRDTDGDGVPDGVEDANRDGEVDPGESDPRVHGLFPGSHPYIPEPLVFDLVRGLGAARGELEANALVLVPLRPYRGVLWAPELEWAFADGHAIEMEIPMHDFGVDALKVALQGTIPDRRPRFIHGWQAIAEYTIRGELETTALYLAGVRPRRRTSFFVMVGPRVTVAGRDLRPEILLNPSIFVDAHERFTFGLENNLWVGFGHAAALVVPQVHWQVSRHFRLQLGAGAHVDRTGVSPVLTTRVILE